MERGALHLFPSPTAKRTRTHTSGPVTLKCPSSNSFEVVLMWMSHFVLLCSVELRVEYLGATFKSSHVRTHAFRTDVLFSRKAPWTVT